MTLPDAVIALLATPVEVGQLAQAFPLVTVDDSGFPHVALLSAVELAAGVDGSLCAVLAGPTSRANLLRSSRATLIAVEGTTIHTVKLVVRQATENEDVLGVVFDVHSHKPGSLGVDLSPIGFRVTAEVASMEQWDRTRRVLAALGPAAAGGAS